MSLKIHFIIFYIPCFNGKDVNAIYGEYREKENRVVGGSGGKWYFLHKKFEEALLITHQLQCNNFKTSKYKNNQRTTVGGKYSKIPFVTTKLSNILPSCLTTTYTGCKH